jgi:hypothetical protein
MFEDNFEINGEHGRGAPTITLKRGINRIFDISTRRRRGSLDLSHLRWSIGLALAFTSVVLVQGTIHLGATLVGRPYENWDEVATFNSAYVVPQNSADALRTYRYGSIDTFIQWTAIVWFNFFDRVGPQFAHIRYSNIAPESWDDPYLPYREKTWNGPDYNYFRGVDDRQPIFISRQLHLITFYLVFLIIGYSVILIYGLRSIFALVGLLILSTAPEEYFQATQSLPNGINAILTFGSVLFAMIFCDQRRLRYLIASVVFLAVGINFKADVVLIGLAPMFALLLTSVREGLRFILLATLTACVVFISVFITADPAVVLHPKQDIGIQSWVLLNTGGSHGVFINSLPSNIYRLGKFTAKSVIWTGIGPVGALIVGIATLAALLMAGYRRTYAAVIPLIGAGVGISAWAAVVLKGANIADRYLLNGLAALLASVVMSLILSASTKSRAHFVVVALLLVGLARYASYAAVLSRDALVGHDRVTAFGRLDPVHNRNLATTAAIRLAQKQGYERVVLVDQHSYLDLRAFRINDLEPKYVNLADFNEVIARLPPGKRYVVVFSRGDYTVARDRIREAGEWSAGTKEAYDIYLAELLNLPNLRHFLGKPQRLLYASPVEPDDEMFISVLSTPLTHSPWMDRLN